jgi:hypothetical protein
MNRTDLNGIIKELSTKSKTEREEFISSLPEKDKLKSIIRSFMIYYETNFEGYKSFIDKKDG